MEGKPAVRKAKATEGKSAIRIATENDFVEVGKLIYSLFPEARPLHSEKDVYFVAEEKGSFCGFVHVRLLRSSLELQGLGVLPAFRDRGLGKALVSHALKWAEKTHPHLSVHLKVKPTNASAISLYLKEGFVVGQDDGDAFKLVRAKPN